MLANWLLLKLNFFAKPVFRKMRARLVTPRGFTYFEDTDFSDWISNIHIKIIEIFGKGKDGKADAYPYEQLSIVVRNADGISRQTTNFGLEILLSSKYITEYSPDKAVNVKEAKGQIVYQLAELFLQITCKENLPSHLVSGLCDFARLALKVDPPHWSTKQEAPSSSWKDGFSKTAKFLQFVQATKSNFIARLIELAATKPYSDTFFKETTGQAVDDLFNLYAGFTVFATKHNDTVCHVVNKSANQTFAILCDDPASFLAHILKSTLELVYPNPAQATLPRMDQIILYVEDMDGVAHCNGGPLPYSSEIHLSTKYITSVLNRHEVDEAKKELEGVLRHEMVHAVQSNGFSTLPGGLVEGIADYYRLIGGYPSINWKGKPKKGEKWTNGYADCAFFLLWLEKEGGLESGFVWRLNAALLQQPWSEELWKELAGGKSIDELFQIFDESIGKGSNSK